jgi:hypothetical protein
MSTFTNQSKTSVLGNVEGLYDSYSESNADVFLTIPTSGTVTQIGQSFIGNGGLLTKAKFYLKKSGATTGNITAYLYAHSGTYGTSSVATGSALATSTTVDSSTLTSTATLYTFTFDGTYTLVDGTNYVIAIEYTGGDYFAGRFISVGSDQTSSTHAGNSTSYNGSWTALASTDLAFYIYTIGGVPLEFTNQSKNSASATNQSKNSASYTNESISLSGTVTASAGQGMGLLLAWTYSGGEVLSGGSSYPVFTNQSRSSSTFTNQSKN